ncbi:ATPase [Novimethylophilus kurashikiensis]|uniref:Virulence sensor protein BvgS n=1 Tax=Novimethylophilus kurashikiensis TaxID=1825523 RepID=A0A2R5FB80_9PROT|nr:ATP-binding protein [Novimethylophilus kurashikiensis]GBG15486.1 ATPase [Novimethylophilus kurashikiensis]
MRRLADNSRIVFLLHAALAVFAALLPYPLQAANQTENWRAQIIQIRQLAENNVPLAYEQAMALKNALPDQVAPGDLARVLNLLARTEIHLAETEAAGRDAQQALQLATQTGDRVDMAEAELNIALNAVNQSNIEELERAATHSLELLKDVDRPDLLGEAMLRAAMMYRRVGKIDESVKMTVQAMEIAKRSTNPLVQLYAHQGMAVSLDLSDQPQQALAHFSEMLSYAKTANLKMQEAYALTGMGGLQAKLGQRAEGEATLREAIRLFTEIGTPIGIAHSKHALVTLMLSQGRYREAQSILSEIIAIFNRHPHKIGLRYVLLTRSLNEQKLGNMKAAQADAEHAYRLSQEIGLSIYISESAQRMAELTAMQGDFKHAYAYQSEATTAANKISREKINSRVLELMDFYETEGKKQQIDELKRRNEQQAAELKQRELRQRLLWTVLGGSIFMLAGITFFLFRLRHSHRMLAAVNEALHGSQAALEKQTEILQSILDSMGDGVSVANEHSELVLMNPAGKNILGIKNSMQNAADWSRYYGLYLPDQVTPYPTAELPLIRAIQGESRDGVEIFVRNPMLAEGRWLSVTGRPLYDKNGEVRGGVAVFSDITARKHAEEEIHSLNASLEQKIQARTAELRQQARYLRTLIDALPLWVWLKDTQSRYLAINLAAASTHGLRPQELIGKSDFDVHAPDIGETVRVDDLQVMASRTSKTAEEIQTTPNGEVWMETFKSPVLDEDGTVLGTVGFARDISDRKATEAAREAALAEAQRLAKARSDFLAQMSHELRTPLNGILGYAQILLRDKSLSERQTTAINVIMKSGEHLLNLINDILDFAKIEARKTVLYPSDIPFIRFLDGLCEMVAIKATQKKLVFRHAFADDLPQVIHADEKRLRQILLNLLSNAVKFTDHGEVIFRVSLDKQGVMRFEVSDTGPGIAEEEQQAIFQPFEQGGTMRHRIGGTGLGLAISREYARLMGGEINVHSILGQGSTFWLELKVDALDHQALPAAIEHHIVGYEGPRRHILIVDDVVENRLLLVDKLSELGFLVTEAANGKEAWEIALQQHPDLICMDVIMPDIDGLELTRRLRSRPEFADTPIVAVSASISDEHRQTALDAGMNAFIAKPIDFNACLRTLAELLQLQWRGDHPEAQAPIQPSVVVLPPPELMTQLHNLALRGNMRDILEWLAGLTAQDPRYTAFAEQLSTLAKRYQSKALLQLVEESMPPRLSSPVGGDQRTLSS